MNGVSTHNFSGDRHLRWRIRSRPRRPLDDFVYSIQPIDLEIKDTIDMSKGLLHTLRLTMMAGWERNFTSQNIAAAHAYGYSSVYTCVFHQVCLDRDCC